MLELRDLDQVVKGGNAELERAADKRRVKEPDTLARPAGRPAGPGVPAAALRSRRAAILGRACGACHAARPWGRRWQNC